MREMDRQRAARGGAVWPTLVPHTCSPHGRKDVARASQRPLTGPPPRIPLRAAPSQPPLPLHTPLSAYTPGMPALAGELGLLPGKRPAPRTTHHGGIWGSASRTHPSGSRAAVVTVCLHGMAFAQAFFCQHFQYLLKRTLDAIWHLNHSPLHPGRASVITPSHHGTSKSYGGTVSVTDIYTTQPCTLLPANLHHRFTQTLSLLCTTKAASTSL